MTKFFTFCISLFYVGTALAQPVLSDIVPQAGDTYTLYQQDEAPDPGPAGENQTWDFSGFTIGEYQADCAILDAAAVPNSDQFPGATLVTEVDMSFLVLHSFMSFTNNQFTDYGSIQAGGDMGSIYDDPKVHFTYPISYGDTGSDTYSGTILGIGTDGSNLSGSMSYVVDGYGTLITPNNTFNNVLRITVTGEEVMTTFGTDITTTYTETYWYSNGYGAPLFVIRHDQSSVMGTPTDETSTTSMTENYSSSTGIGDAAQMNPIEIYPNPASHSIHVDLANETRGMLYVYNAAGKKLIERSIFSNEQVDVSSLAKGIYVAEIVIDGAVYARKSFITK